MTDGSVKSVESVVPQAAKPPQPTEFPPPVARTIDWLQQQYGAWYRRNPPTMPDRFTRREFGYILWPERPGPPPFLRHRAYEDAGRFHWYLQKAGPHSVYYSTAYYRRPGELKMVDKQWLGAELIFDLDADHLVEAEKAKADGHEMPLAAQLALVKTQFKRLLDEFLFGDFGLGENDVWITFSGGRGYHAHVVESRLMQLDSKARREVVDYITGKVPTERGSETPDLSTFIRETVVDADSFKGRTKKVTQQSMAAASAPGWPGRITRTLVQELRHNVLEADPKAARKWLTDLEGVGETRAKSFLERFDEACLARISRGNIDQGATVRSIIHHVLKQQTIPLAKGETDEPVTADVKRLIRLPGSLHGKSGLKVVTLTRSTLDAFDPLKDAVAFPAEAYGPVTIVPRNDQEMTLGGERVAVKKGEPTPVPMAHAVFWLARQGGTIHAPPAANR
ncbi:MAG TPA: DNA primase catalytic subunit PriS [Candidatus Thermoplasmatota archaeon]|nr:DNA primase catalytic subunit PriS [Candidatus Thermoplasmatota archaeon]